MLKKVIISASILMGALFSSYAKDTLVFGEYNSVRTPFAIQASQMRHLYSKRHPQKALRKFLNRPDFSYVSSILTEEANNIGLSPVYAHVIAMIETNYAEKKSLVGICLTKGALFHKTISAVFSKDCPMQAMGALQIMPSTSKRVESLTGFPMAGSNLYTEKISLYANPHSKGFETKFRYGIQRGLLAFQYHLNKRNGNFVQALVDYNAGENITNGYIDGYQVYYRGKSTNKSKLQTGGIPYNWDETINYIWFAYYYAEFVERYAWLFGIEKAPKNYQYAKFILKPDYHNEGYKIVSFQNMQSKTALSKRANSIVDFKYASN